MRVGLIGVLICGCGSISSEHPDAANTNSLSVCDVTKPFGPPVPLDGVNTDANEDWGWLSEDQKTIYLGRFGSGQPGDIYTGTRPAQTEPFGNIVPLAGVDTPNDEHRSTLTADGLTLFVEAYSSTDNGIYVATRTSTAANFLPYVPVAVINTPLIDRNPWISEDGLIMYLSSNRTGTFDIFRTTRDSVSNTFSVPVAIGELNVSTADEVAPVPSKDGLEIFFGSTRDQENTTPHYHIFHATRSTVNDGFGSPTTVAELNSISDEFPNWLSPDHCQLMFQSTRVSGRGGWDLWIARRQE